MLNSPNINTKCSLKLFLIFAFAYTMFSTILLVTATKSHSLMNSFDFLKL